MLRTPLPRNVVLRRFNLMHKSLISMPQIDTSHRPIVVNERNRMIDHLPLAIHSRPLLRWFFAGSLALFSLPACGGSGPMANGQTTTKEAAGRKPLSGKSTDAEKKPTGQTSADRILNAKVIVHRPRAAREKRTGEDWPQFLGPRGTGVSGETGLIDRWPAGGPPIIWEKRVGAGYSAPSIRGDRLVLVHRAGNEEIVDCLNAGDGSPLWRYRYPSSFRDPYGYNNGPRCTPLLTKTRCYTYGAEGKLLCLDLKTGRKLWMRDVKQDFHLYKKGTDIPNWFFGIGSTPILEGNLLITLVGGQPNSAVVAFNAETGKTVWQHVGQETWNGVETGHGPYRWTGEEQLISYSSPIAATIHGRRHVLCLVRQGLVSLNPKDGRVNFKFWFRPRVHESVSAARPVVVGDKILLSVAYKLGSALLQVHKDGRGYDILWKNPRNLRTHWSTAIEVGGYLYGFTARNEADAGMRCIELKTGRVVWRTNGFTGNLDDIAMNRTTGEIVNRKTGKVIPWPFYGRGSAIRVGDKFIVLGERGTLALVRVSPKKFEELARTSYKQIHVPSWTAPVLSRKRLYLRCEDALLCLDVAPPPARK